MWILRRHSLKCSFPMCCDIRGGCCCCSLAWPFPVALSSFQGSKKSLAFAVDLKKRGHWAQPSTWITSTRKGRLEKWTELSSGHNGHLDNFLTALWGGHPMQRTVTFGLLIYIYINVQSWLINTTRPRPPSHISGTTLNDKLFWGFLGDSWRLDGI